jgi:FdhD protein
MECWKLIGGRFERAETGVVVEKEFQIAVNGRPLVTASIMPGMEKEFVVGYLLGQGFIDNLEEIVSLEIEDRAARVSLRDAAGLPSEGASYRVVTGGGRSAFSSVVRFQTITSTLKVDKNTIFGAMNALFERAELYRGTEGTHASGLFTASGPVCVAEDIGRHNSIDKVIGYALLNRIDCSGAFLVSTGRMSSEMVAKVCRAGIPIVATKTAVTDRGLELAREYGLTLVGFVRDRGTRIHTDMEVRTIAAPVMKVYTGAGRVNV